MFQFPEKPTSLFAQRYQNESFLNQFRNRIPYFPFKNVSIVPQWSPMNYAQVPKASSCDTVDKTVTIKQEAINHWFFKSVLLFKI